MRTKFQALLLMMWLVPAWPAAAHFVWVVAQPGEGRQLETRLFFSEDAAAGSAELVDRMRQAEVWAIVPGEAPRALKLDTVTDKDEGWLAASTAAAPAIAIETICPYGVFARGETALLLNYYGKHLHLNEIEQLAGIARSERLPMDVVPSVEGNELVIDVLWKGQPAAGAKVTVTDRDDTPHELTTDAEGRVRFADGLPAAHSIRAQVIDADDQGELDGKAYTQAWHICTVTFGLPASASVVARGSTDDEASHLLEDARQARAVWEGFPGLEARLTLHVDGTQETGTIRVADDGSFQLEGFESLSTPFVRQQLGTLLSHRLPDPPIGEGASFVAEEGEHVLGRKIRLHEESMGSIYRIHDDVVTEVNREMGRSRFTISVLDVEHNAEKKYLPHVFTVSFWEQESGKLQSTLSYYHRWERIGPYDLPTRLVIVHAADGKREVTQMDFADHRLATDTAAAQTGD